MPNNKTSDIKIYLKDIAQAVAEIFDFLPAQRNFFEFQKDVKTRKAIERKNTL